MRNPFSHRGQDAEWQDAVIARLDSLAAGQSDLRRELADHVMEGRPTPGRSIRAAIYLGITALLITVSVSATILSPTLQSEATTDFNQAQTAIQQVNRDLQPVERLESKYGAKYLVAHPNKALLADLQASEHPAQQYSRDNAEGNHLEFESFTSEYFGEIILAISSACFGAIAGYLFIPVLIRGRSRRRS